MAAYTDLAAQIVALRARVGQGTSTEILSDAELTECLSAALREVNHMKPLYQLKSFLTVANQQTYSETEVGFPTGGRRPIRKVFWKSSQAAGCPLNMVFTQFGDTYAWWVNEFLNGNYHRLDIDPGAMEIAATNYSYLQLYFGGKGKQLQDGSVWLDPIPASSNIRVYYFVAIPRFSASASVDDQFAEAYMTYAEFKANMIAAKKQSEMTQLRAGYFGKQIMTAGGAIYLQAGKDAERRFYGLMGGIPKLYYV